MKNKVNKKLNIFIFIHYILGSFAIMYFLYEEFPNYGEGLVLIYFCISFFTFVCFSIELGELIENYKRLERYVKKDIEKRNDDK